MYRFRGDVCRGVEFSPQGSKCDICNVTSLVLKGLDLAMVLLVIGQLPWGKG